MLYELSYEVTHTNMNYFIYTSHHFAAQENMNSINWPCSHYVWLHSSVGRASHQHRRRSLVQTLLKPWFFSGFFFPIASCTITKNRLHHQRPPTWLRQELQSHPIEGFVWACCLLDQTSGQKRKVWWSWLLIRLDYVRKQTLLPWAIENVFKVSRKKPKCDKVHNDLTKPQWQSDRYLNLQELEVENF